MMGPLFLNPDSAPLPASWKEIRLTTEAQSAQRKNMRNYDFSFLTSVTSVTLWWGFLVPATTAGKENGLGNSARVSFNRI
jgi:hypothetical protein